MQHHPPTAFFLARAVAVTIFVALLGGCSQVPPEQDADVIVVGAGIAGLSAALEASARGTRVLVLEANSVGGGHAVKAGGFALVGTALQREKGIEDSPDIAIRDFYRRGKSPDPWWTREYVEKSATEIYDWLTGMGVEFKMVLPTPDSSVPRFHFTRGTAVNAVVPMMRKALQDPNIRFVWNTRVTALARARGQITGVFTVNERDGSKRQWRAASTVLATGGFQSNLQMVRDNWPQDVDRPKRIFAGAGRFANGDGYRLAKWAGADMLNLERQVTFYGGVPDPDDASGTRGLYVENPAAIWLGANGRRFVNETADAATRAAAVEALQPMSYWMIFDEPGSRRLNVRDALQGEAKKVRSDILNDPVNAASADSLAELARQTGLPEHALRTSIEAWNRMVEVGDDFQFGRFGPDKPAKKIQVPPYYALRVYPLTRKNMGGPAIDIHGQLVTAKGTKIPGLYAAGELTGVAGINGLEGGAGTFLGPSVLTGRIAGGSAAEHSKATMQPLRFWKTGAPATAEAAVPDFGQPGYWHYDVVHQYVSAQAFTCDRCHGNEKSRQTAVTSGDMLARLTTCTGCH